MKRRLAIVALAATGALLAACGGNSDSGGSKETTSSSSSSMTTSDSTPTSSSAPPATSDDMAATAYCTDLRSLRTRFAGLNFGTLNQKSFDELQSVATNLKSEAPGSLQDDWDVLITKLGDLETILNDAGLTFDDFPALLAGQLPPGLSRADAVKLAHRMKAFAKDSSLSDATEAIRKNVQQACGFRLGTS